MKDYSIEELQAMLAAKKAGEEIKLPKKVYEKKEVTITTSHTCVLCGHKWSSDDKYIGVGKRITRALKREMMHLTCSKCLDNLVLKASLGEECMAKVIDHCIKIIQRSDRIISDKYIYEVPTCNHHVVEDEDEPAIPITVEEVECGYEI